MPVLNSIAQLLLVVLIGSWLSAWIAFGSPRIAYAGFQVAFAFFLCVIQGAAPAFDLTIARDRTIGILLGNVVVYLIFTRVWPVSVSGRVDATLAALREQWARLTALTHVATRRTQAAAALATGEALRQDIALMHYEPSWVRPSPEWIGARRATLARFDALEGPMLLLAERHPGDPAIGDWLRRLAEDGAREDAAFGEPVASAPATGLNAAADDMPARAAATDGSAKPVADAATTVADRDAAGRRGAAAIPKPADASVLPASNPDAATSADGGADGRRDAFAVPKPADASVSPTSNPDAATPADGGAAGRRGAAAIPKPADASASSTSNPDAATSADGDADGRRGTSSSASPKPTAASAPPAPTPDAASDPLRNALRALGDARLIQLERAASDDPAKEHTIHAPA
ncbi:FUSC family protein [Burkholderia sp. FERM BP-3421]|nr:FUSC family protein [Burkholderia sp. FERM BP-3421]WDD93163.1 FUSC family protein [Burkholderia sp. FERM BP-3421]